MRTQQLTTSAGDLQDQLRRLVTERALAHLTGLASNATYRADLDDELNATRVTIIGAAVTEIATLRAELDGPLQG